LVAVPDKHLFELPSSLWEDRKKPNVARKGLGIPVDITSVSSLVLFNSKASPHKRYEENTENLAPLSLRKERTKDTKLTVAPPWLSGGEELLPELEDDRYIPRIKTSQVQLETPEDLPDLQGFARNVRFEGMEAILPNLEDFFPSKWVNDDDEYEAHDASSEVPAFVDVSLPAEDYKDKGKEKDCIDYRQEVLNEESVQLKSDPEEKHETTKNVEEDHAASETQGRPRIYKTEERPPRPSPAPVVAEKKQRKDARVPRNGQAIPLSTTTTAETPPPDKTQPRAKSSTPDIPPDTTNVALIIKRCMEERRLELCESEGEPDEAEVSEVWEDYSE